jgi:hypothetical protein
MEKNQSNPKIRTALFVMFAIAMVLTTTSLIVQISIQSAHAEMFYDYLTDEWVSCPHGYFYDEYDGWCYMR